MVIYVTLMMIVTYITIYELFCDSEDMSLMISLYIYLYIEVYY